MTMPEDPGQGASAYVGARASPECRRERDSVAQVGRTGRRSAEQWTRLALPPDGNVISGRRRIAVRGNG
jgi:hypothetical protein